MVLIGRLHVCILIYFFLCSYYFYIIYLQVCLQIKEALYRIWCGVNRLGDSGVNRLGDTSAFVNTAG